MGRESSNASGMPDTSLGNMRPRVYDDIRSWVLFEKAEGNQYAVGSLTADRYIAVPENMLDTTMALLRLFDGQHSLSDIKDYAREERRQEADVEQLYRLLSEGGLVVDPPPTRIAQSEFKQLSIKLFQVSLTGLSRLRPVIKAIFTPIVWITLALIVVGLASMPSDLLSTRNLFQISSSYFLGLLVLDVAMMMASLLHELAHCLVAIRLGLTPRKFAAVLYLGFISFFYVEITGIYTLKPKDRIKIWLAGSWVNVTIAGVIFLIRRLGFVSGVADQVLLKIAIANLMMVVGNLSPLMPTDGYFIMCTLLKVWNVRTGAWQMFKNLILKGKYTRGRWLLWGYFILAATIILRAIVFQVQWLVGVLSEGMSKTTTPAGRVLVMLSPIFLILLSRVLPPIMKRVFERRAARNVARAPLASKTGQRVASDVPGK